MAKTARADIGKDSKYWIRHLASGATTSIVLAAHFERTANVWDLASGSYVRSLETGLDFGGNRLALSPDGSVAFVGAYQRYGISAYSVISGEKLWERRDLKRVQEVSLSPDGAKVYCGLESRSLQVLDAQSGATIEQLRGIQSVTASPFDGTLLLDGTRLIALRLGSKPLIIKRETFAVLDAAFAPGRVVTSESGGPIKCIDLASGADIWRFEQKCRHALDLAYLPSCGAVVANVWSLDKRISGYDIYRIDLETGMPTFVVNVENGYEVAFCDQGTKCVTADGTVYSTNDGSVLFRFPLPPYNTA